MIRVENILVKTFKMLFKSLKCVLLLLSIIAFLSPRKLFTMSHALYRILWTTGIEVATCARVTSSEVVC